MAFLNAHALHWFHELTGDHRWVALWTRRNDGARESRL